jgi:hypothetical protein
LVFFVEILMLVCVQDYSSKSIAKDLGRRSWASISKLFCNVDPFIWILSRCTDQIVLTPSSLLQVCDDLSGAIWVGKRNLAIWSMLLWTWWRFYDHPTRGYQHFLRPQYGTAFEHPPMPHTRCSCSWG